MPSGPKKRKAAKKKKANEANINSSTNTSQVGLDEDVRSEDGKNNGSGEFGDSALYDHQNCHNSLNGPNGKLEKNDASSKFIVVENQSLVIERIQVDKETINESGYESNCVLEAENKLISSKHHNSSSIYVKYIDFREKFYGRDDKNLINSSDDKPGITDKNTKDYTLFDKTSSFDDKDNSLPKDAIQINKFTSVGEDGNSLVETVPVSRSVKSEVSMSNETIFLKRDAAVENTVVSDTLPSNQGDGTRASVSYLDSAPKENDHKVMNLSGENDQVSSGVKENGLFLEGKLYISSATPIFDASKDDTIAKASDICSKSQISASAPLVAQRTSFFGCCGLFDLLKGSK